MSKTTAAELLAQIKAFDIKNVDDVETKQKLHAAARELAFQTEEGTSALFRNTLGLACRMAIQRVALEVGIFPAIVKDNTTKTISQLAELTKVDPVLLLRLLRALAAFGVVTEGQDQTYSLRSTCKELGDPILNNAMDKVMSLVEPLVGAVPSVIRENGKQNPTDRFNGAAQKAFNAPGKELFEILMEQGPETGKAFSIFLSSASHDSDKPHEVYPVDARLIQGYDPEDVFWVDVGGGFGQFTIDLKKTFPALPGSCIVQDQPGIVAQAKLQGLDKLVEFQEHDFFTEQPIKGARTYYFRQCFHNWQDSFCKTMLEQTAKAMKPDYSRLLLHELIIPERGATEWEALMDMMMMAGYSTDERSEKQWHDLVSSAGLKVHKIYSTPAAAESVIEIIKE